MPAPRGLGNMRYWAPALAIAIFAAIPARAFEPGDDQFPNSITAPERGTKDHHRVPAAVAETPVPEPPPHASLLGHEKFVDKLHRGSKMFATRGSSGSVLPAPLPRTPLMLPEGGSRLTEPVLPQQQGPTVVPGLARTVPNLPHGPETFQDRASRCAFQSDLYGVPGAAQNRYMGACVQ
jgi:hypothetical protein